MSKKLKKGSNIMYPPFNMFGQNNIMQNFNNFKQNFQGDPKQQVQELLNSGKMSQQQFNQLSFMAQMFQQLFK